MAKSPTAAKKPSPTAKQPKNGHANGTKAAGTQAKTQRAAKPQAKPKPKPKPEAKPKAPVKPAAAPVAKAAKKPRTDLAAKILHLIAEEMAIEEAELTATASFKEDLNLDEIDVAELLMQSELAFSVHPFSEADWDACETVGDFIQLIEKRVAAKRGKKA